MSGTDSDPVISPSLTDAEIARFIALIDAERLRSYNITKDEISRIAALYHPDLFNPAILTALGIFISSMCLYFAGGFLYLIYENLKGILTFAYNAAQGLKDIAETYFAETYTVFRQESQPMAVTGWAVVAHFSS
ncbi:hypothetical protein TSUD_219890 [Trifolium subterraneum]|uniref:Uncharacterized protein n=1 Tax=Trifolium subterraneum TaxID=3900 RepID=A0A2Z6N7E6_TRISU|nr:hypothetical protein TSUD_219890 [Trifolium subterraneum]